MSAFEEIVGVLNKLNIENTIEIDVEDAVDHGELVRLIVQKICDQIGITGELKDNTLMAALLHDIGKLKISEEIYGRDSEKFEIEEAHTMKLHASIGYEMLKECGMYNDEIMNAVYSHHENYDGSGYPRHLKEKQIPLSARIIKVCDVFAALISKRPYRDAIDPETALKMMIEDNRQFDIKIFLEFMKLYNSEDFDDVIKLSEAINRRKNYVPIKICKKA